MEMGEAELQDGDEEEGEGSIEEEGGSLEQSKGDKAILHFTSDKFPH